ncbi:MULTISPECIES: hypothetical protein [Mycolicibacterium]|jgi:hypothetical protein|uniref:PE-PGRS family protein n=1 Tax=Mycolicibacterium vanbaalenii (strain DSM 7251 / JCM 13017 / BCRC 16820 / KCTC 9966 / NRRL B-24157 / PYR-1) TaxID=350058 RepID=A1T6F8_MYCVP|nr:MULTISPECIES: hypothetical protein [Mycolicibacterium]ABM12758.1 hypothetical protein Mvan_1938 [Mycolicibacterium vanbaalenii PYR-1]MCV7129295.1 hypothetical protein [Mycolicibacterium vanbaalenii PYR-1]MDW5613837.1 hypothetical protein [Mycolicibacterium sp. D5.8-2]QZT58736.1 hypothetical protein JN084_09270 [Mycolicibacterium austroafricanum]QZY47994.1 hypothetical protein K5L12_09965 [Mycolicibacterium austroafricanum]
MPNSIRPWVTAGVAVVGVGVIAVAPLEPVTPRTGIQITSAALELAAAAPFDYYPRVVSRSLANAGDRLGEYLAAPLPIVRAVADNQYEAFAELVNAVGAGDVAAVLRAVVRAIATPVVNLAKVAGSGEPFRTVAGVIARLALPVVSGALAAGAGVADVVEALLDLDLVAAFNAVTNLPARIVDGLLNGRVDGVDDTYYGLLTPAIEAPVVDQLTGPVEFLIDSLQDIGDTISSPTGVGAAEVPAVGAATVTLPAVSVAQDPASSGGKSPAQPAPTAPPGTPPDPGSTPDDAEAESPSAPEGPGAEDDADPSPSPAPEEEDQDSPTSTAEDATAGGAGPDAAADDGSPDSGATDDPGQ